MFIQANAVFVAERSESCSHSAALPFYLLDFHKNHLEKIPDSVTCTGRPMTWNRPPPHKNVNPVCRKDMTFTKASYGKTSRSVSGGSVEHFEPQKLDDCQVDDASLQPLLHCAQSSYPQSLLLQFWNVTTGDEDQKALEHQDVHKLIIPRFGCKAGNDKVGFLEAVPDELCAEFMTEH